MKLRTYQFSISDLLRLTVVVSVALGTNVLVLGPQTVHPAWSWVSLVIIFVTWYHGRWRRLRSPSVARSIVFYATSLLIPAIGADSDMELGAVAWMRSYWFGIGWIGELIGGSSTGALQITGLFSLSVASCLGAIANTLIVFSWIGFCLAMRRGREPRKSRWMAWAAAVLMVVCLLPLMYHGVVSAIYPGYALWLGSAVQMDLWGEARSNARRG